MKFQWNNQLIKLTGDGETGSRSLYYVKILITLGPYRSINVERSKM